jgi:hypothetical protein
MQKDVARCTESVGASRGRRCKRCAQGVQNLSVQVRREDAKGVRKVFRIFGGGGGGGGVMPRLI